MDDGLAHVDAGARNLAKLVELSGRSNLPVFAGRPTPLKGSAEFPAPWRKLADELPGVELPATTRPPASKGAADYLIEHLKDQKHLVRILALGPLTNIAEALEREPSVAKSIQEIVIMGGAIRVPGNLGDGGAFQTSNKTAEWNIFVDPWAARIVFRSHIPILLVPLDATNKVPIDLAFLREFQAHAHSSLGRVAAQVLEADREVIEGRVFLRLGPAGRRRAAAPGGPPDQPDARRYCAGRAGIGTNGANTGEAERRGCDGCGRRAIPENLCGGVREIGIAIGGPYASEWSHRPPLPPCVVDSAAFTLPCGRGSVDSHPICVDSRSFAAYYHYSYRSAKIGSIRLALRAGINPASRATKISTTMLAMAIDGSLALMP